MPGSVESRAAAAEFAFTCPLAAGLHARPASLLSEIASPFACECVLTNLRTGSHANLKSTLAIISADVRHGDRCEVRCTGADQDKAVTDLRRFVEGKLASVDDGAPAAVIATVASELPHALRDKNVAYLAGEPVSDGVGIGAIAHLHAAVLPTSTRKTAGAAEERTRWHDALVAADLNIVQLLEAAKSKTESGILKAHRAILQDPEFTARADELIGKGESAEAAVQQTASEFRALLSESASAYIRERALDVQDVATRLLEHLAGPVAVASVELTQPSIVVAESLTPQELLRLPRDLVRGLVVEYAGATSHTIILARSLGIPAVSGVRGAIAELRNGARIVVDGLRGLVIGLSVPDAERFYAREAEMLHRRNGRLLELASAPATTIDGRVLEVAANISSAVEIESAFRSGADGIGVFRTEMLFVDRDTPPTEQEQFEIYKEAARAAQGRPVIIRTIDIGGDKHVPHLNLPEEPNPFLGYRGARIYPEFEDLFRTQVRAVLRASAVGKVQIMLPMISTAGEVRWARQKIEEIRSALRAEGTAVSDVPVGIMVEVPAAAFAMTELAEVSDFFSLGTNDLAQYFFAADRCNARVMPLADPLQPAFLRLLDHIVRAAHSRKKWIGICGEMGGDPRYLPLLLGLGLDEISASAVNVPALKQGVARFRQDACSSLLRAALNCASADDVRALLEKTPAATLPLLDKDLIVLDCQAPTKEEAIHELVDALFIAGRTENRTQLEDAVFAREAVYSTALGFGFAIPHCKSDAVISDSIAVLKLATPIPWGEETVQFAILLAMRVSNQDNAHMQVFSRLARKLMDEDFRTQLNASDSSSAIMALLREQLGL